jgi:hypothetical protein
MQQPVALHPSTFEYLSPTDEQKAAMADVRHRFFVLAEALKYAIPDGPDKTYLLRKLREVAMWANVAITRHPDGDPRP